MVTTSFPSVLGLRFVKNALLCRFLYICMILDSLFTVNLVALPYPEPLLYSSTLYFFVNDKPLITNFRSPWKYVVCRSTSAGAMPPPYFEVLSFIFWLWVRNTSIGEVVRSAYFKLYIARFLCTPVIDNPVVPLAVLVHVSVR
jgi:hypothetical protein